MRYTHLKIDMMAQLNLGNYNLMSMKVSAEADVDSCDDENTTMQNLKKFCVQNLIDRKTAEIIISKLEVKK
jgi:hypothetical protein